MLKIHPNIIIGNPYDLSLVLDKVNYIFNCSSNLNNLIIHQNYLNLNISSFSYDSLYPLLNLYNYINNILINQQNVFILCVTGINHSLVVGMFIIMKLYNINFDIVYHNIIQTYKIGPYELYSGLKYYEPFIINNCDVSMDTFNSFSTIKKQ